VASAGIGSWLRQSVHSSLRRVGVDVVRYDAARFPELRRVELIRERGVTLVLDVGANNGPFARSLRASGYPGRIVSFEPQSTAYTDLAAAAAADARWECRRVALGARDGDARLHLAANSSSSSFLEMGAQHLRSAPESLYIGDEDVSIARLDTLRNELVRPNDCIYLKVDVQGLELDVLRGAAETLQQVAVLDIELSLVPLYDGAPLFPEVVGHLGESGFGVLALEPVFVDPADQRVLQLDGLFGRIRG
jgi:FkbM family methyltransferase